MQEAEKKPSIEKVLANQDRFDQHYPDAGITPDALQRKFEIAQVLLEDGRYSKRRFLVQHFTPPRVDGPDGTEVYGKAKGLKHQLRKALISSGEIDLNSPEAEESAEDIVDRFEKSQEVTDWMQLGVPFEVITQLISIDEVNSATSDQKSEEMRSWVTNKVYRPYIGKLSGIMPKTGFSLLDIMDCIPERVFNNPYATRYNLVGNYIAASLRQHIDDLGVDAGLSCIERDIQQITESSKRQFLEKIYEELIDIATTPTNRVLREKIVVKGQEKVFPCFDQATFCYYAKYYGTRLLNAGTGLGKTNTAYEFFEESNTERVLVLVPASGQASWREQEKVVYKSPGNVFIVRGEKDLDKALTSSQKYVVVSHELLGRAYEDPALEAKLCNLVQSGRIDGSAIDEIDNLSNPAANSTKVAWKLLKLIRQNHETRTGKQDAPVIGLTATLIKTGLENLDVPMAMMYPAEYAIDRNEATQNKKTFSDSCLQNPHLAYIKMIGERRIYRWENAKGVQPFGYQILPIEASPSERVLYDYIESEVGGDALNKIRLLEDVLLNPLLVKAEVQHLLKDQIPEIDLDEILEILKETVRDWQTVRGVENPQADEDYLNEDRLVELGLGHIVRNCFFSNLLENGVDTLITSLTQDSADPELQKLSQFWRSRGISTKYRALKNILTEALSWREVDGQQFRRKVIIVSPSRKQGRTGEVKQRMVKSNGTAVPLYRHYEKEVVDDSMLVNLIKQWAKEQKWCQDDQILILDATAAPLGKPRDKVIKRWTDDPSSPIEVAILKAAYQSRDFTLNNLVDAQGRKIDGVWVVFLGPLWYNQEIRQMTGRNQRQCQLVPAGNMVLVVQNSAEVGKSEAMMFTELIERMAMTGVQPNKEQQNFIDSKRKHTKARILRRDPQAEFLRRMMFAVKGTGEELLDEYLSGIDRGQEKNNAQRFAEAFFDHGRDRYRRTGYNAEMIASFIQQLGTGQDRIADIGAGTLLLQRELKRGIDNVDCNPFMMEAGWELAGQYGGRKIVAKTHHLNEDQLPSSAYDFINLAFVLDWPKLGDTVLNNVQDSMRAQFLVQSHRALKVDGRMMITLPEVALDDDKFIRFTRALESHFGCEIDQKRSGKSFGISQEKSVRRLGWCIVAKKVGSLNFSGLNLEDLMFKTDNKMWVSEYTDRPGSLMGGGKKDQKDEEQLHFVDYRIINPLTKTIPIGQTIIPKEEIKPPAEVIKTLRSNEDMIKILKGQTPEDYEVYREGLIRQLHKICEFNWTQAEKFAISKLKEADEQGRLPENQLKAFQWILREAKRLQKNGQKAR